MSNRSGFSLIETVIAMIILAGAIITLTNSWSGSLLAIRKARQANTAALLLQQKMTEMEIKYEGKPFGEVKEEEAGDFGENYPEYTWQMKSKKLQVPDMSAGMSSRQEGVSEIETLIVKKLGEFIEKSVLELKVTISRQVKEKKLEYSATTYLVDYTQNLAGGL
ncbi:MAG: prepilin-type N-terminal cleavage/methylation domain-containing protein [Bdellovibrionia bacterium]